MTFRRWIASALRGFANQIDPLTQAKATSGTGVGMTITITGDTRTPAQWMSDVDWTNRFGPWFP